MNRLSLVQWPLSTRNVTWPGPAGEGRGGLSKYLVDTGHINGRGLIVPKWPGFIMRANIAFRLNCKL